MGVLDRRARSMAVTTRGSIFGHCYTNLSDRDIRNGANNQHDFPPGFQHADYAEVYGRSDVRPLTGGVYITSPNAQTSPWTAPPSPAQQNLVRVLRTHNGEISQAWLDLDIAVAAADNDLTLKIAVGQIGSDGITSLQSSYSQSYIDASWRKISGTDSPLTVSGGHLTGKLLNLLPALLNYGDTGWDQDIVLLILQFNKVPAFTTTYRLKQFNLNFSNMGVL